MFKSEKANRVISKESNEELALLKNNILGLIK